MGKEDTRFDDVVNVFIDYFMGKKSERLNAVEKKILKFAFSKQVLGSYEIQCANGKHYFHDKDYCNDRVGKGELKQKFQSLFSSKFNINLN